MSAGVRSGVGKDEFKFDEGQVFVYAGRFGREDSAISREINATRRRIAGHEEVQRFPGDSCFTSLELDRPAHVTGAQRIDRLVSSSDVLLERCAQLGSIQTREDLMLVDCPQTQSASVKGTLWLHNSHVDQIECGRVLYVNPRDGVKRRVDVVTQLPPEAGARDSVGISIQVEKPEPQIAPAPVKKKCVLSACSCLLVVTVIVGVVAAVWKWFPFQKSE